MQCSTLGESRPCATPRRRENGDPAQACLGDAGATQQEVEKVASFFCSSLVDVPGASLARLHDVSTRSYKVSQNLSLSDVLEALRSKGGRAAASPAGPARTSPTDYSAAGSKIHSCLGVGAGDNTCSPSIEAPRPDVTSSGGDTQASKRAAKGLPKACKAAQKRDLSNGLETNKSVGEARHRHAYLESRCSAVDCPHPLRTVTNRGKVRWDRHPVTSARLCHCCYLRVLGSRPHRPRPCSLVDVRPRKKPKGT